MLTGIAALRVFAIASCTMSIEYIVRNPKPEGLKKLTGTNQRSRARAAFSFPMASTLAPPEWLTGKYALEEWGRMTAMLAASNVLTPADQTTLAHACASHDLALRAMEAVGHELTQTSKTELLSAHPLIAVAERARAQYLRYAAEFGLSPRARRLGLGPAEEEETEDALSKFTEGG